MIDDDQAELLARKAVRIESLALQPEHFAAEASSTDEGGYRVFHVGRTFLVAVHPFKKALVDACNPSGTLHVPLLWPGAMSEFKKWSAHRQSPKVVIWTTRWVWESVPIANRPTASFRVIPFLDWKKGLRSKEDIDSRLVVLCPGHTDIDVTMGAALRFEYTVRRSGQPGLRIEFYCNGDTIRVDPLNDLTQLVREKNDESVIMAFQRAVGELLPPYDTDMWGFMSDRYRRLNDGGSALATWSSEGEKPVHGRFLREALDIAPLGSAAKVTRNPPRAKKCIAERLLVGVLCGGLKGARRSDPIDPCKRIPVEKEGMACYPMLLEWHVRRINAFAKKINETIDIALVTTPDTDAEVREECLRIQVISSASRGTLPLDDVRIHVVRSMLTVQPKSDEQAERFSDGGFELTAGGSWNALQTLLLFSEELGTERCLIVPFNNIGNLYDETTKIRLDQLSPNNPLITETIKLNFNGPWSDYLRSMSFKKDNKLIKLHYKSNLKANIEEWSTGTWYGHLGTLREQLRSNKQSIDTKPVPRDIDKITDYISPFFQPIQNDEASNPFANNRFLVMRTVDDAERRELKYAFDSWIMDISLPAFLDPSPGNLDKLSPVLLTPTIKRAPWGMEAWFGASERAPSTVEDVIGQVHSIKNILNNIDVPVPPIMVKYLDAHDALSVQLHPDEQALQDLDSAEVSLTPSHEETFAPRLKDKSPKEESFLILNPAPTSEAQLIYGFNRDTLAPIADSLWSDVGELVHKADNKDSLAFTRKVRKKLHDILDTSNFLGELCLEAKKNGIGVEEIKDELLVRLKPDSEHLSAKIIAQAIRAHARRCRKQQNAVGLEYLIAAIGIIEVLRRLSACVRKDEDWTRFDRDQCPKLFRFKDADLPEKTVLGCLFNFVRSHSTSDTAGRHEILAPNTWGQVRSGFIHAWLGGGTQLIEISELSDNTFRILDHGRELRHETSRMMHHFESMFAIRMASIVSPTAVDSGFKRGLGKDALSDVHPSVTEASVLSSESTWQDIHTVCNGWSLLANPDNSCEIQLIDDKGSTGYWTLPPRRSAYLPASDDHKWQVRLSQPSDRVLVVSGTESPKRNVFAIISIGETRHETAISDSHRPDIVVVEPGDGELQAELEKIREGLKEKQWDQHVYEQTALIFPGYYDPREAQWVSTRYGSLKEPPEKWFPLKSKKGKGGLKLLPDAGASALGERAHPDGGLRPSTDGERDGGGIILNVGSGLCVGFSPPKHDQTLWEPFWENEVISALSAMGRWMYINILTGEMEVGPSQKSKPLQKTLIDLVFPEKPDQPNGIWLRASRYFSWSAIAARWLLHMKRKNSNFSEGWAAKVLDKVEISVEKPEKSDSPINVVNANNVRSLDTVIRKEKPHEVLGLINHIAQEGKDDEKELTRRFIINVACELASALSLLEKTARVLSKDSPEVNDYVSTDHVVLCGWVGHQFGRVSTEAGIDDLFLHAMRRSIRDGQTVNRSRIASAVERELAGFQWLTRNRSRNT